MISAQLIRPMALPWKALLSLINTLEVLEINWGARRIRPTRGRHLTGRYPLGDGKPAVPYESGLERDSIAWLLGFSGLNDIASQPVTVVARVNGKRLVYTPDLLVDYTVPPPLLAEHGFGERTFVEVKPLRYARNEEVLLKLAVLRIALQLPVALLTEQFHLIPMQQMEGSRHVH